MILFVKLINLLILKNIPFDIVFLYYRLKAIINVFVVGFLIKNNFLQNFISNSMIFAIYLQWNLL